MLGELGKKITEAAGKDIYPGLMGMFMFLHFYYAIPEYGWVQSGKGAAAIIVSTLAISFIAFFIGNGFRVAAGLIATALALDFFYQAQNTSVEHLLFNYLLNGPAAINYASFGFVAAWIFSQHNSQPEA